MLAKTLLRKLMSSPAYKYIITKVMPFARFSVSYSEIRGWKYKRGYDLLKPGHILLSVDRHKLNSIVIPGTFSHAALCVDKGSEWEVSEMTHKHYTKSTFYDICSEADRVVILECSDFDESYIAGMIELCKRWTHIKYDIRFEPGTKNLYCSELIYEADFERRIRFKGEQAELIRSPIFDVFVIPPDDFLAAHNMHVVWDSDAEQPLAFEL